MSDTNIKEAAREYVRLHHRVITEKYASLKLAPPVRNPETILMAGPPGAGKTEFTQELLDIFQAQDDNAHYVLLDPDEIRENFQGYTGTNAELFNSAVSLAIDKILDYVYGKSQSVMIDGTFAHIEVSEKNIIRALKHSRPTAIFYVYQEPELAWIFVKKREALERRRVSKEAFIDAFIRSRDNVNSIKNKYQNKVKLHIVVKDDYNKMKKFHYNADGIDNFIKNSYDYKVLEEKLRDL